MTQKHALLLVLVTAPLLVPSAVADGAPAFDCAVEGNDAVALTMSTANWAVCAVLWTPTAAIFLINDGSNGGGQMVQAIQDAPIDGLGMTIDEMPAYLFCIGTPEWFEACLVDIATGVADESYHPVAIVCYPFFTHPDHQEWQREECQQNPTMALGGAQDYSLVYLTEVLCDKEAAWEEGWDGAWRPRPQPYAFLECVSTLNRNLERVIDEYQDHYVVVLQDGWIFMVSESGPCQEYGGYGNVRETIIVFGVRDDGGVTIGEGQGDWSTDDCSNNW